MHRKASGPTCDLLLLIFSTMFFSSSSLTSMSSAGKMVVASEQQKQLAEREARSVSGGVPDEEVEER